MTLNRLATTINLGRLRATRTPLKTERPQAKSSAQPHPGQIPPLFPEVAQPGFAGVFQDIRVQARDLWCWASVTEYMLAAYGVVKRQCEVATDHLSCLKEHRCCPPSGEKPPVRCNKLQALSTVLERHGCLIGFRSWSAVTFEDTSQRIETELDAGRPVGLRLLIGGAGHFVVLRGLGGNWYYFLDPYGAREDVLLSLRFLKPYKQGQVPFDRKAEVTHIYWTVEPPEEFFDCLEEGN